MVKDREASSQGGHKESDIEQLNNNWRVKMLVESRG